LIRQRHPKSGIAQYYCDLDEEIAQQDWSNILAGYRHAAV